MRLLQPILVALVVKDAVAANFDFFGVNESGPEFGEKEWPGVKNKHYVWPNLATIDSFITEGRMNTFRINYLMERLHATDLASSQLNSEYRKDLVNTVDYITKKGKYAMINPHNYGRFRGNIITNTTAFGASWRNVAALFVKNDKVIFDTNNEFNQMDQDLVVKLNQAAIDGIRSAGAKQWINVEGNHWSGAHSWTTTRWQGQKTNAESMINLKDPEGKIMYQMHQYLDSDSSGTKPECRSTNGKDRLEKATAWLKQHKKVAIIGEYAAAPGDPSCEAALKNMLQFMAANNDVWKGAIWWAAGPWWPNTTWGDLEPGKGKAYKAGMLKLLAKYA